MSGVLRLGNTGAGTGRSTLEASASNDQTFTLPSAGGTLLTSNTSIPGGTITLDGATINITNGDLNVDSGTLFVDESTNRVGIGTTAPASILSIQHPSNPALGFYTGTTLRAELDATVSETTLTSNNNSPLLFKTGGSGNIQALAIDATGRILINAAPSLSGTATVVIDSQLGNGSVLRFIGKSSNDGSEIDFYGDDNTTRLGYFEYNNTVTKVVSETNVPFKIYTNGGANANERFRITSDGTTFIGNAPSVAGNGILNVQTDSNKTVSFNANQGELGSCTSLIARNDGNTSLVPFGMRASELRFATGTGSQTDNQRMTIDGTGRVLIGTISSRASVTTEAHFQIEGTSANEASMSITRNNTGGNPAYLQLVSTGGSTDGSIDATPANATLGQLIFGGSNGSQLRPGAYITAKNDSGSVWGAFCPTVIEFATTPTNGASPVTWAKLKSTGAFMMGETTGGASTLGGLSIFNADVNTGNSRGRIIFTARTGTGGGQETLQGFIGSTEQLRITANGNITNINNSYGPLSDISVKENIVDAKSQWEDLKAIRVVNFNFKEELGYESHKQIGVIAQEIEEVSPGLVSEMHTKEKETPLKAVATSVLYMKAVKALQEAMTRIEALESEVSKLRSN